MCYEYAIQQGAKFLLIKGDGTIKAFGKTERELIFSRQRRAGDKVIPVGRYKALFPVKY